MSDGIARFMEPVARAILGDPNPHLSSKTVLRFGANGSLAINLEKGTAYSHEAEQGGGVLWLLERERHLKGTAAFDFLEQIGCQMEESPASRSIVATYDYRDEGGKLLFQVCRFEPKTFRQRAPDGTWKVRGIRQVPYRLPEIAEAISQDKTIFIVEGEKDVENLARWNIPATCNAGGAGKWPENFADHFHDADVVIIPDNDQPGRSHANLVATTLLPVARRVRVLNLPGLPAKGDFSDWRDHGGTVDRFHELTSQVASWVPSVDSKFGGMHWGDIGNHSDVVYPWLVEDVVPLGEITLAYGDSGCGKSFALFDMAMCVARNQRWFGRNVEPGLVVWIAAEGSKAAIKCKMAYTEYHGVASDARIPFYMCSKRPDLFSSDYDTEALISEIATVARFYSVPLVMIVLDTLSAISPGMNENASQDVSRVRARLVRVSEHFPGAGIVVVHHKPKDGSTPRGHGSLTADFETTIEFGMTGRSTRDGIPIRSGALRKQRAGRSNHTICEFTLPVVTIGQNKWGNAETSCAIEPVSGGPAAKGMFQPSANEMLFLQSLFEALIDHAVAPPAGLPDEIRRAVDIAHVRAIMKSKVISGEDDVAKADNRFRAAFKRAGDSLKRAAVIGFRNPLVWYTGKPVTGLDMHMTE